MYEVVIGLEVHAQLKTKSKLFCSCSTSFGQNANSNVCSICLGLPGVLPVLNEQALEYALKAAVATHCEVASKNVFERKNYFYPDLPKAYQISQYQEPLAEDGHIIISEDKKIRIKRIHMEEDAGKLIHSHDGHNGAASFIDFNRAAIPLIEIVTEPDIHSPQEAIAYLKELKAILEYLDVCDCNMEKGNFRCDANISLRSEGVTTLGTKVEIKNLNSFKYIEKALLYEIDRQKDMLEAGTKIMQETRLWNEDKEITSSMRSKEEAHDYRYLPDPDLKTLYISEELLKKVSYDFPELPAQKKKKFIEVYGLTEYDTEVLTSEKAIADYFEEAVSLFSSPKIIANWIQTEVLRVVKEKSISLQSFPLRPPELVSLLMMIETNKINASTAKKVFTEAIATGKKPDVIVKEQGLEQISDNSAIETVIDSILAKNQNQVKEYLEGKEKVFGFLVGTIMKEGKGKFNPKVVNDILAKKLKER